MSYARSPRPLCSMTIGIRPRPWGAFMFVSSIRFNAAIVVRPGFRKARGGGEGLLQVNPRHAAEIPPDVQQRVVHHCGPQPLDQLAAGPISSANVAGLSSTFARASTQSTT